MKNNVKINSFVMAIVAMVFGVSVQAQNLDTLGIHVFGGFSSDDLKSSNIGYNNQARGYNSFASGYGCEATGHTSTAIGRNSKAIGHYSVALGNFVQATQNYGIVIGSGASESFPLVNETNGIMLGTNSEHPTLVLTAGDYIRTGKVGIGKRDPQAKLHIRSNFDEDAGIILEPGQMQTNGAFIQFRDESHRISVGTSGAMSITAGAKPLSLEGSRVTLTGKVGVNTNNTVPGYAFAVAGGIITDEVLILNVEDWPDYVFGQDHQLMSLSDLKAYIDKNSHLPEVPSAMDVEENGVNVVEMQKVLLKKIEELTLYTVEQQRLIEELQAKINQLENQ
ncbi:MAG: hypothetical protein IJK36_09625 [Bacteroidales bacterium]|nr:hypothetical protein [Bacteroidales bacterium]